MMSLLLFFSSVLSVIQFFSSRLMMDSRVVNQIKKFYRQDAKFTERKKRVFERNFWTTLILSVNLASWR
jgi:hypothetical protein